MKRTLCAALALAALLNGSFPAYADNPSAIKDRLKAASASVHSVEIDMEMSPPGAAIPNAPRSMNIHMTVATPTRAKAIAVVGPIHIESYQVDGMLYVHIKPGDSWRKMSYDPTHPPAQVLDMLRAAKNEQIAVLPDIEEDGVTVGEIQIEARMPAPAGVASVGPPVSLTCSYDKATYLMRSCANANMSMTFTKYGDPSNTVDLPTGAATAVLMVTTTPAPAIASPSAAPTTVPMPTPTPTTTP